LGNIGVLRIAIIGRTGRLSGTVMGERATVKEGPEAMLSAPPVSSTICALLSSSLSPSPSPPLLLSPPSSPASADLLSPVTAKYQSLIL